MQITKDHNDRGSRWLYKTTSGLQYKILQKGSGEPAKAGQEVLIFETTTYLNGMVLYSNEHSASLVKVLIGGNQATDAKTGTTREKRMEQALEWIAEGKDRFWQYGR